MGSSVDASIGLHWLSKRRVVNRMRVPQRKREGPWARAEARAGARAGVVDIGVTLEEGAGF